MSRSNYYAKHTTDFSRAIFYTFYLIGPIIVATPNKAENLNEKICAINYVLPFRTKISEIVD